jgi:hypothetical protein
MAPTSPASQARRNARTTPASPAPGAADGRTPRTRRRPDEASCRQATSDRPTTSPTSANEYRNTSCRTNATRSAGVIASRTIRNAMVTDSSSVTRSAGSPSPTGSGRRGPAECRRGPAECRRGPAECHCGPAECRTRADPSTSRQIRPVTFLSQAPGDATAARSPGDSAYHRAYAS